MQVGEDKIGFNSQQHNNMLELPTTYMTKDKEKHVEPLLSNSETLAAFNLAYYVGLITRSKQTLREGRQEKIR